ncbi:MAG: orotate phosphoribosyltransferase [Endomicrobium sp.]|jgi:orotate phosphoribosyltransferase|nr:orotate phosphoribosyltransferase [Endomicrobium sp.]
MHQQEVKQLFEKNKALLSGHFKLSSGLHSDTYFQSALILQYPQEAEKLGAEIASLVQAANIQIDTVISPALGGLIIGQEVARSLKTRALFTERIDGKVMLRRGFKVEKDERILVVEDVITTGLSTREVIALIQSQGAKVAAVASLVDRSAGKVDFGVPKFSLLTLEVKSYKEESCPMCQSGSSAIKPGSRKER